MKRLVWLVLAVCCTAFAQVSAGGPWLSPAASGECCAGCDGACGMPECALPPASWTGAAQSGAAATVAAAARKGAALRRVPVKFSAAFAEPASRLFASRASPVGTPAASVSLFKAHCSFLL
ncbi:MAG: hypothetical protein HY302_06575 [Opitutae bacterium]|nr:hypothetical protein [Opitutae bacterium]